MKKRSASVDPVESLSRQVAELAGKVEQLTRERKAKQEAHRAQRDSGRAYLDQLKAAAARGKEVAGARGAVGAAGILVKEKGEAERRGEWVVEATLEEVMGRDVAWVARALAPLGDEAKLRIAKALFWDERSVSDLVESTRLTQAQIYHHMRHLLLLGYVEQTARNVYRLSSVGWTWLFSGLAAAAAVASAAAPQWSKQPLAPE